MQAHPCLSVACAIELCVRCSQLGSAISAFTLGAQSRRHATQLITPRRLHLCYRPRQLGSSGFELVFQLLAAFSRLVDFRLNFGQRLDLGLFLGLLLLAGVVVAPSLNLGFQFRCGCGNALDTCLATLCVCVCVCVCDLI